MTTLINGDDIIRNDLDNQSIIPSVSGIINAASLKSSSLVDLTPYLGGWGDDVEFDPTKPTSFKFTNENDASKLSVSNAPSKNGLLPSQSYKVSFASGDKSTTFSGTANLSNDRPNYNTAGGFPSAWRYNSSFSYKTTSGTTDITDDIIATATVIVNGTSDFHQTSTPGVYTGNSWQMVNSSQSYKVGLASLTEKHIYTGTITLNENSQVWNNRLFNMDFKFVDNSDPNAKFALSYKGEVNSSITFTDYNNMANNIGTNHFKLNTITVSDSEKNYTMTTRQAEFDIGFDGSDALSFGENVDNYETIKDNYYGDIFNNNGQQDKSMAYNILRNDNVYKSTQTSSDNGSMGSFIFTLDGKDNITGSKFDDFIMAGRDADIIKGGLGADTFSYSQYDLNPNGSTPQRMQMDIISDFSIKQGDKINVTYDSGQALIYDTLGTKSQGTMWFDKGTLWMNFNRDAGYADAGIVLAGVKTFGQGNLGVASSWAETF